MPALALRCGHNMTHGGVCARPSGHRGDHRTGLPGGVRASSSTTSSLASSIRSELASPAVAESVSEDQVAENTVSNEEAVEKLTNLLSADNYKRRVVSKNVCRNKVVLGED